MSDAAALRALPGWPRGLHEHLAAAYVGLSVSTVRTLREHEDFPAPVRLTERRLVFLREDLDAWLDEKAGRRQPPGGDLDWPDG